MLPAQEGGQHRAMWDEELVSAHLNWVPVLERGTQALAA